MRTKLNITKTHKDKSGKVESIPSMPALPWTSLVMTPTKMYGYDNSILPRMVLPPSDVPPAMVDGVILSQLHIVRAWLRVGTWILDLLVWGQISPPTGLDFLPRCFNISLNVFEGFGKLDAKKCETDFRTLKNDRCTLVVKSNVNGISMFFLCSL